jgi:hypothetical protein
MAIPASQLWPRNCTILGTERFPSSMVLRSVDNTCGILAFIVGSAAGDLEGKGSNDYYIYINGTNPMTPMFGNVTNVMTTPAGGTALATAIAAQPWDESIVDGASIYGSQRVSSSVALVQGTGGRTGLGFMTDSGNSIEWLYVTGATPNLCHGTEAQMLAGTVANSLGTTTAAGSLGIFREGRTVYGNTNRDNAGVNPVVLQSGGRGAGLALTAGDQHGGVAMWFTTAGAAPSFGTWQQWWAWSNS